MKSNSELLNVLRSLERGLSDVTNSLKTVKDILEKRQEGAGDGSRADVKVKEGQRQDPPSVLVGHIISKVKKGVKVDEKEEVEIIDISDDHETEYAKVEAVDEIKVVEIEVIDNKKVEVVEIEVTGDPDGKGAEIAAITDHEEDVEIQVIAEDTCAGPSTLGRVGKKQSHTGIHIQHNCDEIDQEAAEIKTTVQKEDVEIKGDVDEENAEVLVIADNPSGHPSALRPVEEKHSDTDIHIQPNSAETETHVPDNDSNQEASEIKATVDEEHAEVVLIADDSSGDPLALGPVRKKYSDINLSQVIRDKCGSRVLSVYLSRSDETGTGNKLKTRLDNKLDKHKRKQKKCYYCSKICSTMRNRVIHERIHIVERPFKCLYCDRAFVQKYSLIIHMRTHTVDRPFRCMYCDRAFATQESRSRHMRIHTGERPFSCTVCNRAFTQKSNLTRHMRLHTGERPYSCLHCDRAFHASGSLTYHTYLHTREGPHKCKHCDKTFPWPIFLRRHVSMEHKR